MRQLPVALLLAVTVMGCGQVKAAVDSESAPPRPTAASGREVQTCADVAQPGKPITQRQIADGCLEDDGTVAEIRPYLCRGEGSTVVELRGHRLVGQDLNTAADQDPKLDPPPETVVGTWTVPSDYYPVGDIDINGCDWGDWPPIQDGDSPDGH